MKPYAPAVLTGCTLFLWPHSTAHARAIPAPPPARHAVFGRTPRQGAGRVVADRTAADRTAKALAAKVQAERTAWVGASLSEMNRIKVGMTRTQLLTVFTEEGGISTRRQRTYVYRACPYFKVDVEFRAAGPTGPRSSEGPQDVITKISQPYVAWSIAD